MDSLESELQRAHTLDEGELADAIQSIGFACTRCGACCKAESCGDGEHDPHTATIQPDEVRRLQATGGYDWRDVARPMPFGVHESDEGLVGETFEWALQTTGCGDCTFYDERDDGMGACRVHENRPLICKTYPFSIRLGGTSRPMGEAVDERGLLRAHECEGLGNEISRADANSLASALKTRAITELRAAIAVRDGYEPVNPDDGVVVHDAEGAKRPDGVTVDRPVEKEGK